MAGGRNMTVMNLFKSERMPLGSAICAAPGATGAAYWPAVFRQRTCHLEASTVRQTYYFVVHTDLI